MTSRRARSARHHFAPQTPAQPRCARHQGAQQLKVSPSVRQRLCLDCLIPAVCVCLSVQCSSSGLRARLGCAIKLGILCIRRALTVDGTRLGLPCLDIDTAVENIRPEAL
ncbi:hypothetical protein RRG08_004166 [Elysia crispata]|uniref:Uncharacterized protein n=1 Tax=Elysia crispata TaxID=231223 RepID=A0AAE0YWG0_9GAST|nr:hypothetical protein RRG08_004166 [Elysia crispata]